jgi:radical SAM protein
MPVGTPRPAPRSFDRRAPVAHPFAERPLLAIWELTQACDLACVHCRACAVAERDGAELTTEEGKRLLSSIAAMGTTIMVLTGGDPAKRPDLVELVAHGAKQGLAMNVTPSGTPLVTRELLRALRDAGMRRLAISVDGPDAETHDAFRRVPGSFANTMRILEDAEALGIERQINTSLGPHNLRALEAMAALVAHAGAVLWSVFVVVPVGRALSSLLLSATALEDALGELATIADRGWFDVKTTAAPHFRRIQLERHAAGAVGILRDVDAEGRVRGPRGINDGAGFVFVSHRGDICPSGFLAVPAGNVREDEIGRVYRESALFTSLRDESALGGKCGVCPFRRVCGGSRARAHAMTGDAFAADPLCAYVPRGWNGGENAP